MGPDAVAVCQALVGLGFNQIQIAGILANFQDQASNTAKRFEADFVSSAPSWDQAVADKFDPTIMWGSWDNFQNNVYPGVPLNQAAYENGAGGYTLGIGLGQWTGPRGWALIQYANTNSLDIGAASTQINFMVNVDTGASTLQTMRGITFGTTDDAAAWFFSNWEGGGASGAPTGADAFMGVCSSAGTVTPVPPPTTQTNTTPKQKFSISPTLPNEFLCSTFANMTASAKALQGSHAGSSGSTATPATPTPPNGTIPAIDNIINQSVGWLGAFGQCYGLAQWWVTQCGGAGQNMNSAYAIGNSLPFPADPGLTNQRGWAAGNIAADFGWGSQPGFQGFTCGTGTPPGGYRTGDIIPLGSNQYSGIYGHVIIVKAVNGNDFTFYEQNGAAGQIVAVGPNSYNVSINEGYMGTAVGWVRPNLVPMN